MTVKIEGDLGAVQAAVEAGSNAAKKVGELLAVHIIPNPSNELAAILPQRRFVSKYHPDDKRPSVAFKNEKPVVKKQTDTTIVTKEKKKKTNLDNMTVSELRQIARGIKDFPLKGREISMANKQQLIDTLKSINYED